MSVLEHRLKFARPPICVPITPLPPMPLWHPPRPMQEGTVIMMDSCLGQSQHCSPKCMGASPTVVICCRHSHGAIPLDVHVHAISLRIAWALQWRLKCVFVVIRGWRVSSISFWHTHATRCPFRQSQWTSSSILMKVMTSTLHCVCAALGNTLSASLSAHSHLHLHPYQWPILPFSHRLLLWCIRGGSSM